MIEELLIILLQHASPHLLLRQLVPASKISIEPHKLKQQKKTSKTMAKVNTAPIKWAQRSDSLYITIALAGE
jgi:hypothetical protein